MNKVAVYIGPDYTQWLSVKDDKLIITDDIMPALFSWNYGRLEHNNKFINLSRDELVEFEQADSFDIIDDRLIRTKDNFDNDWKIVQMTVSHKGHKEGKNCKVNYKSKTKPYRVEVPLVDYSVRPQMSWYDLYHEEYENRDSIDSFERSIIPANVAINLNNRTTQSSQSNPAVMMTEPTINTSMRRPLINPTTSNDNAVICRQSNGVIQNGICTICPEGQYSDATTNTCMPCDTTKPCGTISWCSGTVGKNQSCVKGEDGRYTVQNITPPAKCPTWLGYQPNEQGGCTLINPAPLTGLIIGIILLLILIILLVVFRKKLKLSPKNQSDMPGSEETELVSVQKKNEGYLF